MRFRSPILLATLLAAALPAAAQEPVTLTLPDALRRALDANLGLESTRAEIAVTESQRRAILGSILPKISVTGNVTENTEEVAFGSDGDQRTILPATDWAYRLTFSQPIYAGNRERKTLQQATLGTETARQDVSATADRVLLNVAADYLAVVQGEELLAVEQRNLDLARRRREQAQIFFDAGETTRIDVLRAETAIKAAERRLATARQLREAAASRLRLGLAIGDTAAPVRVAEPGHLFPALPPEQALLAEAENRRPEVMRARTAVDIAKLEVGKQRGALLPVVTADGGWINQKSTFPSDQYGFVALRFTVPLYQGGEIAARTVQARERQRQAELRLEEVRQAVREEVHRAMLDLETAEASLRLTREQLAAAEAEYEQANELYRAQELTSLEVESAEASLAEARRAVTTGKLDRDLAELRVWAAAGRLQSTLLPEDAR